jgi:hypothetical protein
LQDSIQNDRRYVKIELKGLAPAYRERLFEGMTLTHNEQGNTVITGFVQDQSALFGLLDKIRNLGMNILSLKIEG